MWPFKMNLDQFQVRKKLNLKLYKYYYEEKYLKKEANKVKKITPVFMMPETGDL